MKKFIAIIISAYSVCAFLSVPVEASETPTFVEKGSKSKSKSKSEIVLSDHDCAKAGPCGETGPKGDFNPVYATLIQETASQGWINDTNITLPLSKKQVAESVTLNATNNSFTLPKGVYTIHFQFAMETGESSVEALRFTDIYLDINGSSQIPLDWVVALDEEGHIQSNDWGYFSGSRAFTLTADSTVKVMLVREATGDVKFVFPDGSLAPDVLKNHPVSISLKRIDEV